MENRSENEDGLLLSFRNKVPPARNTFNVRHHVFSSLKADDPMFSTASD